MHHNGVALESSVALQLKEAGARIKRLREHRRLTLGVLAEQANVGVQTLVRIEEGSPGVALLNLQKVLTILGAPVQVANGFSAAAPDTSQLRHVEDPAVSSCISEAALAAFECLRNLSGTATPLPFDARVVADLRTLLVSYLSRELYEVAPTIGPGVKLLLTDQDVGGPLFAAPGSSWILRLRSSRQFVNQDGEALPFDALQPDDLMSSRADAIALSKRLAVSHQLRDAVDAVPAALDGDVVRL